MCEHADMFPLYSSPSHGHGCVYLAFPRFCSAIMIDSALVVVYFVCRSAVDEETLVSRHCDLTVPVTRCLGCSVFIYTVPNNCCWAPYSFSHMRTVSSSEFALVSLAFHHMCGIYFGIFPCYSYASREVWTAWSACDSLPTSWLGNSGNTQAASLIFDCVSMNGCTRRDTTWMQLVQATLYSVLPRLRQVPFTACVVASACLLTSRLWTSAIVSSW